jgi:hypothetical protein
MSNPMFREANPNSSRHGLRLIHRRVNTKNPIASKYTPKLGKI